MLSISSLACFSSYRKKVSHFQLRKLSSSNLVSSFSSHLNSDISDGICRIINVNFNDLLFSRYTASLPI